MNLTPPPPLAFVSGRYAWTDEADDFICAARAAGGWPIARLSGVLGTSETTIRDRMKALKIAPMRHSSSPRYRVWTAQEIERGRQLAAEGRTWPQIAKVLGRTRQQTQQRLYASGIRTVASLKPQGHRWTDKALDMIRRRLARGDISTRELAARLNVSPGAMREALHRQREREMRRRAEAQV